MVINENSDSNALPGDANQDGFVNSKDVLLSSLYLASKDPATGETNYTIGPGADYNGDGKINVADLIAIRQRVVRNDLYTDGYLITNANALWGGVNAYYAAGDRKNFVIENNDMALTIHTPNDGRTQISSIVNSEGKAYVTDTMDVFVTTDNGTYYASKSTKPVSFDLYRFGMYYYEVRALGQNFINKDNLDSQMSGSVSKHSLDLQKMNNRLLSKADSNETRFIGVSRPAYNSSTKSVTTTILDKSEPRLYYELSNPGSFWSGGYEIDFAADSYNYIVMKVKATSADASSMRSITVKPAPEVYSSFLGAATASFYANTEDVQTLYFKLDSISGYAGNQIKELRIEFNGIVGDTFEIFSIEAVNLNEQGAPNLALNRYFHTYSDKNLQTLQVTAISETTEIQSIGLETKVVANTVEKLVVKDASGTHSSLEGVDWDSAEYIGFDIDGVGIFGYILLPDSGYALSGRVNILDSTSGKMTVSLEDGYYVIRQSKTPANNTLCVTSTTTSATNYDNQADFYLGQRIYTDENHDFDAFIEAAEIERHPLSAENIVVDTASSTGASFLGYDNLRGVYVFDIEGSDFSTPYYVEPNKHFNVKFTVTGDEYDRNMYIMTSTADGELQSATVLDENDLLLPIPVQVGKNFSDGGTGSFDAKDEPWGEAYFPMLVTANEEKTLNFLNIYMNWGRFPLKQISSIQLAPLYHLSTGVTETNCILPWYSNLGGMRNIWTLPDHRAMSAPFWISQPNHTSGGDHRFLRYTDSNGSFIATEQKSNYITSYGPTYAEVVMDYLSDDGKIAVTYTHMEMPQTDETRTYYTMEYTVLEDVTINDFRDNFILYSMDAFAGVEYQKIGYLDTNNESQVVAAQNSSTARYFALGDNCPYFSFFDSTGKCTDSRGYVNLSFLVYNAEYVDYETKESTTPQFVLVEKNKQLYITFNWEGTKTLKTGDTFKINCILMPWGSQESDYTLEDKNVRDVRENTLLDPLTATPVENCTVIESDYLPKLRVTNGREATFTLSGASNNSAVELYGFNKLGIPEVYEMIGGEEVRYNLSSEYYRDINGNGQSYDGYGVKYDSQSGPFAYSFIVDMTEGEDRTFRVVLNDSFVPEADQGYDPLAVYGNAGYVDGPNYMITAENMYATAKKAGGSNNMKKAELLTEGEGEESKTYFRFTAKGGGSEAWFVPYINLEANAPINTGRYLVIKYRMPSGQTTTKFDFFTSTAVPKAADGTAFNYPVGNVYADGEWHVLAIDLTSVFSLTSNNFKEAHNLNYYANFLRFDPFNSGYVDGSYIDVEYIFFDDRQPDFMNYIKEDGITNLDYYNGSRYKDVSSSAGKVAIANASPSYTGTTTKFWLGPNTLGYMASYTAGLMENWSDVTVNYYGASQQYVRFTSVPGRTQSFFTCYPTTSGSDTSKETGQYLILKYRASEGQDNIIDVWARSKSSTTTSYNDGKHMVRLTGNNFVANGEWQFVIIDMSKATTDFLATDGKYYASAIRLDLFKKNQGNTAHYVDLAFLAMTDTLEKALTYANNKGHATALLIEDRKALGSYTTTTYDTATKQIVP